MIQAKDRLIVALDVKTAEEADVLVEELDGLVSFFKVGYQLFVAEGMNYVRGLIAQGKRVFLDLKMDDVDETIRSAVSVIAPTGVQFLTIHGSGKTVRAASEGRGEYDLPQLLSITVLTSLDENTLRDLLIVKEGARFPSLESYVLWRAGEAIQAGCDGLIAAGSSVTALRKQFGSGPIIVTPGIRAGHESRDDHKRAATPKDAIAAGADYLVVGRPIRNAPNRRQAAKTIIDEIEQATQQGRKE
jgi:orotidine-5'-phosphate decarboxylase